MKGKKKVAVEEGTDYLGGSSEESEEFEEWVDVPEQDASSSGILYGDS